MFLFDDTKGKIALVALWVMTVIMLACYYMVGMDIDDMSGVVVALIAPTVIASGLATYAFFGPSGICAWISGIMALVGVVMLIVLRFSENAQAYEWVLWPFIVYVVLNFAANLLAMKEDSKVINAQRDARLEREEEVRERIDGWFRERRAADPSYSPVTSVALSVWAAKRKSVTNETFTLIPRFYGSTKNLKELEALGLRASQTIVCYVSTYQYTETLKDQKLGTLETGHWYTGDYESIEVRGDVRVPRSGTSEETVYCRLEDAIPKAMLLSRESADGIAYACVTMLNDSYMLKLVLARCMNGMLVPVSRGVPQRSAG